MPESPSSSVNASQLSVVNTRKEEVLRLLDSEINHIVEKQKREGLTSWALLGGLATLIWLLLDQLETASFTWKRVLILFLVAAVFSLTGSLMKTLLWPTGSPKGYSRFRYFERAHLGFLLIGTIYLAGLISIAWFLSDGVPWPQVALTVLLLILFLGLIGFAFAFSFLRIPVAVSSKPLHGVVGIVVFGLLLCVLFSSTGYLVQLEDMKMGDFRVFCLIFAIDYLTGKLGLGSRDTPIISSLMEIRRDLAFGRIDLDTAIYQAEIIIAGIPVSEVLQENIRPYLKLLEEIGIELTEAQKELDALATSLPDESAPLPLEKVALVKAVLESGDRHRKKVAERWGNSKQEMDKIFKSIRWIGSRTPESSKAIDDMYNKIIAAATDQLKRSAEFLPKLEKLQKRLPA